MTSISHDPGSQVWLDQVVEEIIDPDQRIIDPHHHLWPEGGALPYGLDELHIDTGSGHRVEATVFVECSAAYDADAPDNLRPVGETRFVAAAAAASDAIATKATIKGIVAHADLRIGDDLDAVLDAHIEAGGELVKGVRHAGASDSEPEVLRIPGRAPAGLYADPDFRAGVRRLGERGLTYDTWHYHHQNQDFEAMVRAVPNTTIILDHFGTPLGVGRFTGMHDEIFSQWTADISAIAQHPNVVAKLGGLAMPDNGFGWHERATPATSDELVAAHSRYYLHAIEAFGPNRCMFESNFPVDRFSVSYSVLWNAMKKIAAPFTPAERDSMFYGTAARVYGLA